MNNNDNNSSGKRKDNIFYMKDLPPEFYQAMDRFDIQEEKIIQKKTKKMEAAWEEMKSSQIFQNLLDVEYYFNSKIGGNGVIPDKPQKKYSIEQHLKIQMQQIHPHHPTQKMLLKHQSINRQLFPLINKSKLSQIFHSFQKE